LEVIEVEDKGSVEEDKQGDLYKVQEAYMYLHAHKQEAVVGDMDLVEGGLDMVVEGGAFEVEEAYKYLYVDMVLEGEHKVVEEDNLDMGLEECKFVNVVNYLAEYYKILLLSYTLLD
jgi:hypothetical protein